jgi:hypothetical protein
MVNNLPAMPRESDETRLGMATDQPNKKITIMIAGD